MTSIAPGNGKTRQRLVVALGGNALLRRGEPMTADIQRAHAGEAMAAVAELAETYDVVLTHGNGPQVGLLALQALAYPEVPPYPLDVLGAESEGMIGYVLEQELQNRLPGRAAVTVLTQVVVDADDPAFRTPDEADRARLHGGAGAPTRARARVGDRGGRRPLPAGRRVTRAPQDRRDLGDQDAGRRRCDRRLHGRRRNPGDHERRRDAPWRRGRHRQGPRRRAAREEPRGRLPAHADGRRRRHARLGNAGGPSDRPDVTRPSCGECSSRTDRWGRRSRPPAASSRPPAARLRSAHSRTRPGSSPAPPARSSRAMRLAESPEQLGRRLAVARGDARADLVVRGGRVFSSFTREWLDTDVAIVDGVVAGLGDYDGRRGRGRRRHVRRPRVRGRARPSGVDEAARRRVRQARAAARDDCRRGRSARDRKRARDRRRPLARRLVREPPARRLLHGVLVRACVAASSRRGAS